MIARYDMLSALYRTRKQLITHFSVIYRVFDQTHSTDNRLLHKLSSLKRSPPLTHSTVRDRHRAITVSAICLVSLSILRVILCATLIKQDSHRGFLRETCTLDDRSIVFNNNN